MNNPNLNEVTLEVDMAVDVPSDVYIYAEDGGMTGGAGTVTGHFTVYRDPQEQSLYTLMLNLLCISALVQASENPLGSATSDSTSSNLTDLKWQGMNEDKVGGG